MSQTTSEPGTPRFTLVAPVALALAVITGLVLIGLVLLFVETFNMSPPLLPGYPGDAFFPRIALVFTMFFAALILLRILVLRQSAAALGYLLPTVSFDWLEIVSVFALVLLYTQLLDPIGFEITTVAFMMALLAPRLQAPPATAIARAAVLAVGSMGILYVGFGLLLKIPLPLAFLPMHIP